MAALDTVVAIGQLIYRILTRGRPTSVQPVSEDPIQADRRIVREFIIFLEDRRALYDPWSSEVPAQVTASVFQIRNELTRALQEVSEESRTRPALRLMQLACRRFLDSHSPSQALLEELRLVFATELRKLCTTYDIQSNLPNRISGSIHGGLGPPIRTIYVPPPPHLTEERKQSS